MYFLYISLHVFELQTRLWWVYLVLWTPNHLPSFPPRALFMTVCSFCKTIISRVVVLSLLHASTLFYFWPQLGSKERSKLTCQMSFFLQSTHFTTQLTHSNAFHDAFWRIRTHFMTHDAFYDAIDAPHDRIDAFWDVIDVLTMLSKWANWAENK